MTSDDRSGTPRYIQGLLVPKDAAALPSDTTSAEADTPVRRIGGDTGSPAAQPPALPLSLADDAKRYEGGRAAAGVARLLEQAKSLPPGPEREAVVQAFGAIAAIKDPFTKAAALSVDC